MECKKYNEIMLCRSEYGKDFDKDLGELIRILCKSGHTCKIYEEDEASECITIEFAYEDELTDTELNWS